VFGSSDDSDSDFEKFIANTKKKQKQAAPPSDLSADEAKGRTRTRRKPRGKRPARQRGKPKPKASADDDWTKAPPSLYRDKENLDDGEEEVEVIRPPAPPKPKFKRRAAGLELGILGGFLEEGLDKEDVQMFKQALSRLRGEEDPLTQDLAWAHYPHNILWSGERGGGDVGTLG
jgi:hypothetical protein